jgi:hypothetical protein
MNRKKRDLNAMNKVRFSPKNTMALYLCLLAECLNVQAQSTTAISSKNRSTRKALSCTNDSQCQSGERCGFVGGCGSKGKCIVPRTNNSCADPGGRCGCDGRPVDIFCGVGSQTEFTSAPTNAVGPCPKSCTDNSECISGLVCQKGWCLKP